MTPVVLYAACVQVSRQLTQVSRQHCTPAVVHLTHKQKQAQLTAGVSLAAAAAAPGPSASIDMSEGPAS